MSFGVASSPRITNNRRGFAPRIVATRRFRLRESSGRNGGLSGGLMRKLTAIGIKNAADGKLQDGGGLILVKRGTSGKWVYRYSHLGKRREMGLGPWPIVTLAAARRLRDGWAAKLAEGIDPLTERDAHRAAEKAARARIDPTVAEAVGIAFERVTHTLRGGGARGRWRSPLDVHVIPRIGGRKLSEVTREEVVATLGPLWKAKPSTAAKAAHRLRIVYRECRAMGVHCDPGTVDAAKDMLGPLINNPTPITATPWQDIPALYAALSSTNVSDECLRWMILTVVRYTGCAGAHASEIEGNVWTVPAERMKGREGRTEPFRVPLVPAAVAIAERAAEFGGLLFSGHTGKPITSTALQKRLNTLGIAGRPHGFRTSFRTWAQDHAIDYEVAETCLAHRVAGKVERAYARSDLLDRRRAVMEQWAGFVTGIGL